MDMEAEANHCPECGEILKETQQYQECDKCIQEMTDKELLEAVENAINSAIINLPKKGKKAKIFEAVRQGFLGQCIGVKITCTYDDN
jgi:hypothetical protein